MNKAELVVALADKAGLSRAQTVHTLDALIEVMGRTLKRGEKITVVGFGAFSVRKRVARQGRNPKTGAPVKIPAAKTPVFKAGKALKDAIK